ncbi:unnamed protein product [Brassica rapa subsp. trilocularis]
MDKISGLSDDLLVKILSFVPTKVAVSTSVLSKRWECLWMWVPTLEYDDFEDINTDIKDRYRVSVHKNLLSHRAPIIESLRLKFCLGSLQPEDIKQWVSIAVSRCVRVLSITSLSDDKPDSALPSSLYTCKTLVTLKLEGNKILVDIPPTVCLPSLTTLQLSCVTYLDEASLRMLLSNCPVLEDLVIERDTADDNAKGLVVVVPSLQRLSLQIDGGCCSYDGYVIDTPSLMYFKVEDYRDRDSFSYLIKDMPKLEEADIAVKYGLQEFLESVTSVKRLSIKVLFNNEEESMYCSCIVFSQLKRLKLSICNDDWSKLLFRFLKDSPKLRVLNLDRASRYQRFDEYEYEWSSWDNEWSVTPNCLLKTLETFEFSGCMGRPQERAFLSFFFTNARCLKSTSILR